MSDNARFAFAVRYVKDVDEAKRFYEDVLGLTVQRYHPTFVQFADFAIASDESLSGADTELYWLIDDADASFARLSASGHVKMPLKQMPFGKVFSVRDSAGHECFLIQLAQDRPSQPV